MKVQREIVKTPEPQLIGDLVDVALKIAEERTRLLMKIREACIAGDDREMKLLVRQLVGLE